MVQIFYFSREATAGHEQSALRGYTKTLVYNKKAPIPGCLGGTIIDMIVGLYS